MRKSFSINLGFELDTNRMDKAIREVTARMKELQEKGTINGLQVTDEQKTQYLLRMTELRDAVVKLFTEKKFGLLPEIDKSKEEQLIGAIETAATKINRLNYDLGNNQLMANKAVSAQAELADQFRNNAEKTDMFASSLNKVKGGLKAISVFALAQFGFRGFTQTITDAIRHVQELDRSLTQIRVVTGATTGELNSMAREFNAMAREFGNTTAEIADTMMLFFRQGRSHAEALQMTEAVIMGARISGQALVEVTDRMTAVINGFQMTAEQAMTVMDSFAILDANMATSFNEMSYALTKVSSQAHNAGIEFEEMLGLVATVSAVTREAQIA